MTNTHSSHERELILLDAASNLANLLHGWNVVDLPELAVENKFTGTPHHHVTTALEKVLAQVGLTADEKMDFYEMVTTGMKPIQAKWRILDHRPQDDDGDEF